MPKNNTKNTEPKSFTSSPISWEITTYGKLPTKAYK